MEAYDDAIDAVIFKHEDEIDGQAIGPVWVRRDGERKPLVPGKYSDAGWLLLRQARDEAKRLGLPFFQV